MQHIAVDSHSFMQGIAKVFSVQFWYGRCIAVAAHCFRRAEVSSQYSLLVRWSRRGSINAYRKARTSDKKVLFVLYC